MRIVKQIILGKIHLLLFIIPAFYFIIGSYFRYILGDLSLRSLDPDYIYFITGLGISEGHLNVFHVDNPGTPLQYLMGLTFRFVYFLRPENGTYLEDVLKNPDLYMAVSNSVITILITVLLFYAGKRIYKSTGSILCGFLLQTTPFLAVIWYDIIGRIVPELLMPIPVIFLEIFLIEMIYSEKSVENKMQIIVLAVISAIGLSVKLTYLPLWFIPLIIIRRWKNKALFVGLSILFFLLFAIPVTLRLGVFTGWIKALFIHSGQYGGGDANFINWTDFGANLKFLWSYEKWFFVTAFLSGATAIGYFLYNRKTADIRLLLITIAVLVTILLQTIMVGKHFEHRYYIPALLLFPILVFLIIEMGKRMLRGNLKIIVSIGGVIFLFAFFIHQQPWIRLKAETMSIDIAQRQETRNFVAGMDSNSIKIIATKNYGCPFKEYALMISYAWSGGHQKYYKETLARLYPDSYLYFTWDNTFRFWGTELTMDRINQLKKPVFVYLENNSPELYQQTINQLDFIPDSIKVTPTLLFQNEKTKETIYQLKLEAKTDCISIVQR